ncbi:hypothetical protein [Mesorhizobium sp. M1233]|uniref:hypothetical protein n=1 Tax=Mesorhizobium sp. M1233 TaxID=2957072 RepID=UPI00333A35D8
MASRFDLFAVPRWQYGEEFLTLLDGLEAALPLTRASDLSDEPLARMIFQLSKGLIGEIVAIVTTVAAAAARSGTERITRVVIDDLDYIPVSKRRRPGAWHPGLSSIARAIPGRVPESAARGH